MGPDWAKIDSSGQFCFRGKFFRAALGEGGIRESKKEGDLVTPVAAMPVRTVFYRADRVEKPIAAVPVLALAPDDGWCDDASSPMYNRYVKLPCSARHEKLWRTDRLYDVIAVLGWNDAPVMAGRGSAIFMHVAAPDFGPTEGCVALDLRDLQLVLALGLAGVSVAPGLISG